MTENETKDETSIATAQSPSETTVAAPSPAESTSTAPVDSDADPGEGEEGEDDGEGEADEGAEAGAEGSAEGGKKKRRRRRRKKKGAQAAGEGGGEKPKHEPNPNAPFARWFDGQGERKHAFATGEIVAGMVTRVEDGAALIDLFGKATAIVDVLEPREIEPIPEPVVAAAQVEGAPTPAVEAAESAESVAAEAPEAGASEAVAAEPPAATTSAGEVASVEHQAAEDAVLAEAEQAVDEDDDASHEVAATPSVENASAEPPEVGAIFKGRIGSVSESGHVVLINRYIDKGKARERIREHQAQRRRVQGVVYGFNRGGFDVIVEGIRVFCPASAMTLEPVEDPTTLVGRKFEFTLPPSKGGRSIVVSRRTLLEREQRRLRRDKMKALEVGTKLKGRVTGHREYGVLVDIGDGLEGLVHLSELGWGRGIRPADIGPVGTEVEVQVTKVVPISRKERFGKIGLSIRACQPDPWDQHADILQEGHAQLAKVTRTAEFGAFLELAPGLDGMLHISELGGRDLKHAGQVLKDGDTVAVMIERVDRGARRVSLSKLSPNEAEALASGAWSGGSAKAPKPGTLVNVVVEKVEHHGIIVQVEGVPGRRGRGYLGNRDLGEYGGEKRKLVVPGFKLEAKIVGTDRDGGLKLSVRAKQIDEERNAVREYKRESSRQGFGTFGDLLRAKLQK